jgi:hypothetical protein
VASPSAVEILPIKLPPYLRLEVKRNRVEEIHIYSVLICSSPLCCAYLNILALIVRRVYFTKRKEIPRRFSNQTMSAVIRIF